jgi:hypothetical protein
MQTISSFGPQESLEKKVVQNILVKNATINTWMKYFSLSLCLQFYVRLGPESPLKIILFSTLKAICREVAGTRHVH